MRTTLELPDDLHAIARSIARQTGRSMGETVADLMRKGLRVESPSGHIRVDPKTGLPIVRANRPITADDVAALDD